MSLLPKRIFLSMRDEHGPVPAGAIIVMLSGWDRWYREVDFYENRDARGDCHYPGFSREVVTFLLEERDIRALGADVLTIGQGLDSEQVARRDLLGAGKYAILNLRGLSQLPAAGATVIVAPIALEGSYTVPARVFVGSPPT